MIHVAVGANHIFNTHPTEIPLDARDPGVPLYDAILSQVGSAAASTTGAST